MTFILLILLVFFGGHYYPVTQQYGNGPLWVSSLPDTLTQFGRGDGIGLLAHNYLAGAAFFALAPGDIIAVLSDDNSVEYYAVERQYLFERVSTNVYTFLDNGQTYTGAELLAAMYQPGGLTLQTCIARNGNDTWGRLFVHAHPYEYWRVRQ
jgi:hypothetical protein